MEAIRVAGATVNQTPLDWKQNTSHIIDAITEARSQQIKIVCFPELCITGYGCEDWFLSEWVPARALEELEAVRPHCQEITVAVGLPVIFEGNVYNGVCVISDTKVLGITCKQFLARDGVHYEPRWFTSWPAHKVVSYQVGAFNVPMGDVIYEAEGIKFGFEICEDGWHKTSRPGYRLHERGVHLIMNPSASHYAMKKSLLREKELVIDGSHLFNCVYLFTNLLGNEAGRMIYDGDVIIGQCGKVLALNRRLTFGNFALLSCKINFDQPEQSEYIPSDDITDVNDELTQALSLALFDYLRKSRARGFVLSLSGGADSSSCAVFVSEMVRRASTELGWQKFYSTLNLTLPETPSYEDAMSKLLTCAYQGTRNSSDRTLNAARSLAESIHTNFHHWTIDDEVTSYTSKIEVAAGRKLEWETDDIALQNIQARARSPIIWMLANIRGAVLLTTSNRSEGDVGYATMDGDTSGSLAPIAGLSKPFLLQWLRWAEEKLGYAGLNPVNNLQPTAELRPQDSNQTDETDLMPYTVLVEIESYAILRKQSPLEVYESMKSSYDSASLKKYIAKFFRLWAANQWKRERLAPSFHLDDLSVDPRTWCRFPILSSGFAEELEALNKA